MLSKHNDRSRRGGFEGYVDVDGVKVLRMAFDASRGRRSAGRVLDEQSIGYLDNKEDQSGTE